MLHAARWKYMMQNDAKKISSSAQRRTTSSSYIFATKECVDNQKKKLVKHNISFRCPYNMANFGPLTTEICWRVSGNPANFNGFYVLASLPQRRCSPQANQTLHDVWPSPGLLHHIYIFRGWAAITLGIGPHSSYF